MKWIEALSIIEGRGLKEGYCVSFEVREGSLLRGDHFPDVRSGERAIVGLEEAWDLAAHFAHAKGNSNVVNVYVVRADNFLPVKDYQQRKLKSIT